VILSDDTFASLLEGSMLAQAFTILDRLEAAIVRL
jgi:hypothetical protein